MPPTASKLPQDDFDSLVISKQAEDPIYDPYPPKNPELLEKKISQSYVPVNSIPEAVYAIIAAWEQSQLERKETMGVSHPSAMTTPDYRHDYEPVRVCNQSAPPKRFYLRFWQSAARRILESDKKSVVSAQKLERKAVSAVLYTVS